MSKAKTEGKHPEPTRTRDPYNRAGKKLGRGCPASTLGEVRPVVSPGGLLGVLFGVIVLVVQVVVVLVVVRDPCF